MKYVPVVLLFCLMFAISPTMAAIIEEPVGTETITPTGKTVLYTDKITSTKTIVDTFFELIGWTQEVVEEVKATVMVQIDGTTIAEIPKGSKFDGIQIHDVCLQYQYGTDNWYDCEVPLQ